MLVGAGPAGLAWEGLGRPSLGPGCGLVLDEVGEALGRQGWLSELRIDCTGGLVEAATSRGTRAWRACGRGVVSFVVFCCGEASVVQVSCF